MAINVLSREHLLDSYEGVIDEFKKDFKFAVITNNQAISDGGILLVGMNPSNRIDIQKIPKRQSFDYLDCPPKDSNIKDDFWDPKHKMMGEYDDHCAYIDLFPLRDGSQKTMVNYMRQEEMRPLMGALLRITQDYIESLHPRLIIFANTFTAPWGFRMKGKICEDSTEIKYDNVWMGYTKENIVSPLAGSKKGTWKFYRITGIIPSDVNRKRETTNLQNSFFLQYRQHYNQVHQPVPEDKELTPADIRTIVEWIDPEWAKELL